jgi:hypothetical protein
VTATILTLVVVAILLAGLLSGFGFRLRFKPTRSRLLIAVLTYVVSFVSVAGVSFLAVMLIAGPHSGFLEPGISTQITFVAGLLIALIVPAIAVYSVLRRSQDGTHVTVDRAR